MYVGIESAVMMMLSRMISLASDSRQRTKNAITCGLANVDSDYVYIKFEFHYLRNTFNIRHNTNETFDLYFLWRVDWSFESFDDFLFFRFGDIWLSSVFWLLNENIRAATVKIFM